MKRSQFVSAPIFLALCLGACPDPTNQPLPEGSCGADGVVVGCEATMAPNAWPGLSAGHVRYQPQTGYLFDGLGGDGKIYRQVDSNAPGGYRFVDSTGAEIMLEAPSSLNLNYTHDGQYDFRLTPSLIDTTAYESFDPAQLVAQGWPLPDLTGEQTGSFEAAGNGWNNVLGQVTNYSAAPGITAGGSGDLGDGVWAGEGDDRNYHYLLLRQKIEIGAGGLLRAGNTLTIDGMAYPDLSLFLRAPDGSLTPLYSGRPGLESFNVTLEPDVQLQPGTNYFELYASVGVVTPLPAVLTEDFDLFDLGDTELELGTAGWVTTGSWTITDHQGAPLTTSTTAPPAGAPASLGKIVYHGENTDATLQYQTTPGVTVDVLVGKPAVDDNMLAIWVRYDHGAPSTGTFFFLRGDTSSGPSELGAARVGLAVRTATTTTLLASDLTDTALSQWADDHGMRSDQAEHWRVRLDAMGERIRVSLSQRGDADNLAGGTMQELIDVRDSSVLAGRHIALASTSQPLWFDLVEVTPHFDGGLRITIGETGPNKIESLDGLTTRARYSTDGTTLYDHMGDGSHASNANPQMSSSASDNWIDYVPETPLALGKLDELVCNCLLQAPHDCNDVSGTWLLEVDNVTSSCGPEEKWSSEITIVQLGCGIDSIQVTGIKGSTHVVKGSVVGNTVTIGPGSFLEGEGTTTATYTMQRDSDSLMTGTESWIWIGDFGACSHGSADIKATKRP